MKANNKQLTDVDAIIDSLYGKVGTPERSEFRRKAYVYCMGADYPRRQFHPSVFLKDH